MLYHAVIKSAEWVDINTRMSHFLTDVDKIEWKLWTTEWKVVTRGIGFHLEWVWMHEFMSAI